MNQRQRVQKAFDDSQQNIIVGDIRFSPITLKQLIDIDESSPYVVETFTSGLTAEVYHLNIDGSEYTLKKKRTESKVQNLDGKYSFLNEVQRRQDFHRLKQGSNDFEHIIDTTYADYRHGIILSPWIEGKPISSLKSKHIEQLFLTLVACEKEGLFEWDLCSGNILIDNNDDVRLFDFGYMYPFDPMNELNSNGMSDPIFHLLERFETRFFFGWLLESDLDEQQQISLYQKVKQKACVAYAEKLQWLISKSADRKVIEKTEQIYLQCKAVISDNVEMKKWLLLDSFRSHVLDIEDDLHGKSCTLLTLKRIDVVQGLLQNSFPLLCENDALFYANEGKKLDVLIADYKLKKELAEGYLLTNSISGQ